MSTITDDETVIDEEEIETKQPAAMGTARVWFQRWWAWPTWARVVSGVAAAWLFLAVVGAVFGGDNKADTSNTASPVASPVASDVPSTTTTGSTSTTAVLDPLKGLPALNPMVAALVHPSDVGELANLVRAVTADGSSICSVYFGLTVVDGNTKWQLTTPAMQAKSGAGVELPASSWPIQLLIGDPCAPKDTPLAATATPATSPVAAGS